VAFASHPGGDRDLLAGIGHYWPDKGIGVDPAKVKIEVPMPEMPTPFQSPPLKTP
jgi:hypothetical protein